MPELIKAFGLTIAKSRANSVERWQLASVPRYYNLGLYLGLQHRGYEATPQLFSARTWEEVPGIPSGKRTPTNTWKQASIGIRKSKRPSQHWRASPADPGNEILNAKGSCSRY